jgi:fructokinase
MTLLLLSSLLPTAAMSNARVLCIGETLFDGLPTGIFLGGAPLNAAVHLAELGVQASYASAVGKDRLGREAVRRLTARGVDVSLVTTLDGHETGFVEVDIDANGDASYTFATPAAWDHTPLEGIATAAAAADAVVFGSLGSRAADSRAAIRAAAASARFAVCDINLRPPFVEDAIVAEAARGVDLLKLNDEELTPLAEALRRTAADATETDAAAAACAAAALADGAMEKAEAEDAMALLIAEAAAAVGRAAQAGSVVVTRGAQGAVYWDGGAGDAWSCAGFVPPTVVDTVGAGDSFLAGLLASRLVHGAEPPEALEAGCRCGAFVASRAGATPAHEPEAMDALRPPDGGGVPKPLLVGGVRV